jgi:DNA-binding CsgD family transcriptional regulator
MSTCPKPTPKSPLPTSSPRLTSEPEAVTCPHCGAELSFARPVRDLGQLTPKQFRVAQVIVEQGLSNREAAIYFGTTPQCIKNVLRVVYQKTGLQGRLHLAVAWRNPLFQAGLPKIGNASR